MTHSQTRSIAHACSSRPSRNPLHRMSGRTVLLSTLACLGTATAFMAPAPTLPLGLRSSTRTGGNPCRCPTWPSVIRGTDAECSAAGTPSSCAARSMMRLPGPHAAAGSSVALREAAANQLLLRYRAGRTGLLATSCAVKTKVSFENDFDRETLSTLSPPSAGTRFVAPTSAAPDLVEEDSSMKMRMAEAKEVQRRGDLKGAALLVDGILEDFPDHGKVWMRRFKLAQKQRAFSEARDVIRRALKHVPGNAILWQAWADLEKSLGRYAVARRLYRKGLEANPRLPSLYNSWGCMERDLGDVSKARTLLREGLMLAPNSARLLQSLGVLEDVAGNADLSRSLLGEGLLLEPHNAFLHHALAVLEFKQGRLGHARESLRRALSADKDHTKGWLAWAQLEEAAGNVNVAREKYREGCKARGGRGTVQLWQSWARMEEKGGNERAALEVYQQATKLYPRDVRLLLEMAKLHEKRGDIHKALTALEKAVAGDKYNPYVYQVLGQMQLRQLRVDAAREAFSEGVKMAELRLRSMRGRGASAKQLEGGKQQEQEAAKSLAVAGVGARGGVVRAGGGEMVRVRSGRIGSAGAGVAAAAAGGGGVQSRELASLLHAWAAMEVTHGDVEGARKLLSRAVEADASQAWLWRAFGSLEASHGDEWLARHYFARAVNADPKEGDTWVEWSRLEEAMGNYERARFYAKRGMELNAMTTMSRHRLDPKRPLSRRWFRD